MNFRQKITLCLLLYMTLCSPAFAQVVHFPDPNLRTAVADAIGVDPDRITMAVLRQLTRIDAVYKEIENLEGLQHAPNLRLLDLNGNRISDLTPLANSTNLEQLLLKENQISDLTPLANLRNLEELMLGENAITDISPLSRLTNLQILGIPSNRISDLTPLANLRNLEELMLGENAFTDISLLSRLTNLRILRIPSNRISDLTPLANLRNLEELILNDNAITDISPLSRLTNLRILNISYNGISDILPLTGLTKLRALHIQHNFIGNHSPVDELSLEIFLYDQICDMPAESLEPRLENRSFPSIFASFTTQIVNRDGNWTEQMPYHDMIFSGHLFGDHFRAINREWIITGHITHIVDRRDRFLALNPNMIFLLEVRIFSSFDTSSPNAFPDNHPYWLRDTNGQIIVDGRYRLINYAHPEVQDIIVGQALAIAKCGVYDGVFFDHWNDFSSKVDEELISDEDAVNARENIVRRIREGARDNFLIIGNTNDGIIPLTGPFINGAFMESIVPSPGVPREPSIRRVRESLEWLETNLREPRTVMLQGGTDRSEAPDSPYNQRLMRATTTMSLTHSDGYVQFGIDSSDDKWWYDFWEADLGQPVGSKFQFYDNTEGLYIREFDNGWAVYNHSGSPQVITLPEEAQGVASGLSNTEHALPNLDGEMYLKAVVSDQPPVTSKNPADVNGDGVVNILDLTLVAQGFGAGKEGIDVNGDGVVNVFDLVFVAGEMQ